ncbi:hypothetical protein A2U01_0083592, partial [Trifolium medium]|nr:hypothetical protein [Trifolium medium]
MREEKNEEEKVYESECEVDEEVENEIEGEVEKDKIVEKKSRNGKQPLVGDPKSQVLSPYAKVPYPRRKK